ncbi:MAG: hypothetical protein KGL02_12980 [Acidobacteriota bacterium]|nr:hypothetical protein [Acidobacteriota bacterium]
MLDVLKGIAGKVWLPLLAWIFPSALGVLAIWFLILPLMNEASWTVATKAENLSAGEASSWLVGASLVLGILLYALSMPLYRLLEGYSWPRPLRVWAVAQQRAHVDDLRNRIAQPVAGQEWERGLLQEKLARYPTDVMQIAPTRLGNALRAFETYGVSRFNLDSQTFWTELRTIVPQQLASEIDLTRCFVDFFVAIIYLDLGFSVIALATIISCHAFQFSANWFLVFLPILISYFAYRMALVASSSWSASVQALVNIGRKPLAESLGIQLPSTLSAERDMWGNLVRFVYFGDDDGDGTRLNRFRKQRR